MLRGQSSSLLSGAVRLIGAGVIAPGWQPRAPHGDSRACHRGRAAIELTLHARRDGVSHSCRVCCSWQTASSGATQERDLSLTSASPEQVEAFIP
jgi:hypothetical protein